MIVNYLEGFWQIIPQRTHGLLAGQLCGQWEKVEGIDRWFETIIATAEHDDVYNEFENDDALLNENGGPVHYKMRIFQKSKCEALLKNAQTRSQYVAILTSRHLRFLYESCEEKAAREYAKKLKQVEDQWISDSGFSQQQIALAYGLLQWCDALSLLICQKLFPPEQRKIEISKGPGDHAYYIYQANDSTLVVEPWPFKEDKFDISFESRSLKQLTFGSVEEFRKLLYKQKPIAHRYTICKKAGA